MTQQMAPCETCRHALKMGDRPKFYASGLTYRCALFKDGERHAKVRAWVCPAYSPVAARAAAIDLELKAMIEAMIEAASALAVGP